MPLGFGKKDKEKDADLDKQKSSLFGGRSKSKANAAAPSSANPYAVPQAGGSTNPYATNGGGAAKNPYAPQSAANLSAPPTSSFGSLTLKSEAGGAPPGYSRGASPQPPRDKSPVPPGEYGGGQARYGNQGSYGQSGGYGSNPYGGSGSAAPARAGGYGGLGRSNSNETMSTDAGRNALFGDAPSRVAQQQQQQTQLPEEPSQDMSYGNSGGYGYGEGPPRELTEQEQEDQDVDAVKQEIKFIKQQDVSSTRNARRIAEQAEQTGRETLARLGQQGERLHNAERNLDGAERQNRLATDKASELKTLNRSMWAVHVDNPFTKQKRERLADEQAMKEWEEDEKRRTNSRAAAYSSQARGQQQQRDLNGNAVRAPMSQKSLADRAKYQFEADSDDDEMENEIDDNMDAMGRSVKVLNQLGRAMGDELDAQNKHIDRITDKSGSVGMNIAKNTAKLQRIEKRG